VAEALRRVIAAREALAIDPSVIKTGPEAFFMIWPDPVCQNERVGVNKDIAVVHIRGPLEHHLDNQSDSYDSVIERARRAITGEDQDAEEFGPPKHVIFKIDSPGGVVAGLREAGKSIRKMLDEAEMPSCSFVDERSFSAAFSLSCVADEIYMPKSAICGSIGVISTMADQTEMDKKMGLRIVTLTSGARKADGHPHVAISSDAIEAEQGRVDKLALQFFKWVSATRGISIPKIQSFQAGIFLGMEAVKAGLVDGIMNWDGLIAAIDKTTKSSSTTQVSTPAVVKEEKQMALKLASLIAKTQDAIKAETDTLKLAALQSQLATYTATQKAMSDDDGDDGDDGDDDGDDKDDGGSEETEEKYSKKTVKKGAKKSKGNETDRSDDPEDDKDDDSDDSDDEDEDESDEEEDESEEDEEEDEEQAAAGRALRSALAKIPGADGEKLQGQFQALFKQAKKYGSLSTRLEKIEKDTLARNKAAMIDGALASRKITPREAKQLAKKSMAMVKGFLEMRPKALVHSTQEDLEVPREGRPQMNAVSPEMMAMFEAASQASDGKIPVSKFIEDYKSAQKNGSAGEY